jgi:hypothetical protein
MNGIGARPSIDAHTRGEHVARHLDAVAVCRLEEARSGDRKRQHDPADLTIIAKGRHVGGDRRANRNEINQMAACINRHDGGNAAARRNAHHLGAIVAAACKSNARHGGAGTRIKVAAPRDKRFRDGPCPRIPRVVRMYAARDVARPEALPVVHLGLAPLNRKRRPARVASVADLVAKLGGAAQSRAS